MVTRILLFLFLQFLYLNVLPLHPFVLEADAQGLVDGHDGMLLVTVLVGTHHAEVKVELDGLPCLLRIDTMFDFITFNYLCTIY